MLGQTLGSVPAIVKIIALPLVVTAVAIGTILLAPMKENAEMDSSTTPSKTEADVPPIDRDAPTETRTATFAMG